MLDFSHGGLKRDCCSKMKCDPMDYFIAQSSANVSICSQPYYHHIARTDRDYNNYCLFFSILVAVKTWQISSSNCNNLIFSFNSNESNKGNKRLLQRLINYRHLNISSNLAACFLGNCRTTGGNGGSMLGNIMSESQFDQQSDTSIGFPSSIFESTRSSFINSNDAIVIRQADFFPDRSFLISPPPPPLSTSSSSCLNGGRHIAHHPADNNNDLLIWRLIPSYEQDPRAFCQISVANVNQCTTSRCVSTQVEPNVIEIECNLGQHDNMADRASVLTRRGETRSILRSGDKKYKNYNQLRLTFAPAHNLVTVFEYPGYDSSQPRGINENNRSDQTNIDNQPDRQTQFQQSIRIDDNDLSELSIVTVEESFDSVSTSLLFGVIQ